MVNDDTGLINTKWAHHLLSVLAQCGVTDVVISPGSRSTPLVLAAQAISSLKKHVILDERSASFFALGLGKASGRPAVLICTSGTAGANYYPACIEASQSYTPMIIITADRPARLQNRHAPQTINQEQLFGNYVLHYENSEQVLNSQDDQLTSDLATKLYQIAFQECGPVHLNAPFSKPLEPTLKQLAELQKTTISISVDHLTEKKSSLNDIPELLAPLIEKLSQSKRPVIVAGPATVQDGTEHKLLHYFIHSGNIPILAESVSNGRIQQSNSHSPVIMGYESFLRDDDSSSQLKPDFILRIGLPPVSFALNRFLVTHADVEQWSFSHARQHPDPEDIVSRFIQAPFRCEVDITITEKLNHNDSWLQSWKNYHTSFESTLTEVLAESELLTDGIAVHHISQAVGTCPLFVSNSLSVRDIDLFTSAAHQSVFYHNRGASGIDGNTSTFAGIGEATNTPSWMITGDLAFLHDSNALLSLSKMQNPARTICVLNNGGGTIFRMLPVFSHDESVYTPYFETPQNADLGKLCAAFGISHVLVESIPSLKHILKERSENPDGVLIIECKTNAESSFAQRRKLWNHP